LSSRSKSGSPRRADKAKYFRGSTTIYNNQPTERTKCFIYLFVTVKPVYVPNFVVSSSGSTTNIFM